jgi:hypothetical protein
LASPVPSQIVLRLGSFLSIVTAPAVLMSSGPARYFHSGCLRRMSSVRQTPPPAGVMYARQLPDQHRSLTTIEVVRPPAT